MPGNSDRPTRRFVCAQKVLRWNGLGNSPFGPDPRPCENRLMPSAPPGDARRPDLGVIGGSGFYEFLESPRSVDVPTPYGAASAAISIGEVEGRAVAFLPRHGRHHELPPHRVNYRANMWALRAVGVRRVLAPCAVGSLRADLGPGDLVVPDQLVDRTSGRVQTFYDEGAVHVPFADPYCPSLRSVLASSAADVIDGGTMVVVEGPRFSTRAESQWFARQDWSLVNMTGHPEAVLARELALCYATIALVTDRDAGISVGDAVNQATVFREFADNVERLRGLLVDVLTRLPEGRDGCACQDALDGITLPVPLP
jgi:5'-methylthioadenosine phosphorylase